MAVSYTHRNNSENLIWGFSSVGRAFGRQPKGPRFDPGKLHYFLLIILLQKSILISVDGGIGRPSSLRSYCRKTFRFKSGSTHHIGVLCLQSFLTLMERSSIRWVRRKTLQDMMSYLFLRCLKNSAVKCMLGQDRVRIIARGGLIN